MPSKTEFYRQMADHVATQLTGSWQEWAGFLTTAARLYKYPFHEQLLIYAQRPDATACAEYDLWNEKMGRYVRRGSKGIALVDDSGDKPRLRYVFDITDTGTREHSRTPWLWKLEEQHRDSVSAMLERTYEVGGDDLAQQLEAVAGKLAGEYWNEHRQDFLYIVDDSFLEEYDEFNIEVQFKAAATVSITYALMSRCGLEPERYFDHEDFMAIFDFSTPSTIGALGTAVSQINQQVLRQIGVTIRNAEREAIKERRPQHEESHELHPERRLSDSRPEAERTAGEAPGQVRQDAESIPQGTPSHPIQPAADEREAVPTPAGNRRDRTEPSGAADAPAGERRGRDGGTESPRSDALGGPDEHLQGPGRGDSDGGAYQQLTLNLFLSEAEQIQRIDEAENVKTSSAFSFTQEQPQPEAADQEAEAAKPTLRELHEKYKPIVLEAVSQDIRYRNACGHNDYENAMIECNAAVRRAILDSHDIELIRLFSDVPEFRQRLHREVADETYPKLHELLRPLSDNDIDRAIQAWNGKIESKHAVVRYMKKHGREKDTAAWLAHEFDGGEGKTPLAIRPESPNGMALPWPKVQRRIAQLIKEDRFYTQVEKDNLDDVDPIAIREALAQRGIVDGHVVDPEKLDNDPFVQQVMRDVEAISRETAQADQPEQPLSGNSRVPVSDEEYAAARGTVRERTYYDPTVPPYHVGDIVYLDDRAHQITELRDDTVQLLPTGMSYPIYRAERQEQFEQLLRADNRNDFYTEFLPANPDAVDQDLRDVLAHGLIGEADKAELSQLLHNGKSNREVALWLSRAYPNIVETMELETGDTADYRTMPEGIELEVLDADEKRLAMLFFRWDEVAPLLRGLYARQLDGFGQERPEPSAETPAYHAETVAVYPGDKNHLPYDVIVQTMRTNEPEPPAPAAEPEKTPDEVLDEHPISIQVNGEWQTFPNARAAEEAAYGEYKENLRRTAENFHIIDDHLGEGGPKAKFQANIEAIKLLKYLEETTGQATPEQQQVLSRYVGWGGLADAFDPDKESWSKEYVQLKELLTPEEYAAARGSTLNAHYTSPTVIRAIYEAVGRMGFETGNILEPSCGVGNFFGMLPENMAGSKLYGVELDSISGRIAQQLYPKADITVAGFETTDRRDFYDLAVGNVPFGQYQVRDKAYDKLNFSIHNYFFGATRS